MLLLPFKLFNVVHEKFFKVNSSFQTVVVCWNFFSGANPTIARYNASVVNFYNATDSLARFENKKYYILLLKTL
jgi:hypothetical protein